MKKINKILERFLGLFYKEAEIIPEKEYADLLYTSVTVERYSSSGYVIFKCRVAGINFKKGISLVFDDEKPTIPYGHALDIAIGDPFFCLIYNGNTSEYRETFKNYIDSIRTGYFRLPYTAVTSIISGAEMQKRCPFNN